MKTLDDAWNSQNSEREIDPECRKKTDVKQPPDTHERDMPNRQDEHPKNAGAEEREIDQILADSFPASDAPPWTLGVAETPPKTSRKRTGRSG